MRIKSDTIFAKKYNQLFRWINKHEYTEYTLTGGRGSCKSSFISLCIVILIVMFPQFNALIIRKNGAKQYIIFRGCDNPEKIKSIKIAQGYFGLIWFEEKTEFTPAEIQNVKVSAMRGGSKFYVFESYNPPSAKRHWCNTDARRKKTESFTTPHI